MTIYTLNNIYQHSIIDNPVVISRVLRNKSRWKKYKLRESLSFMLSNGNIIHIPKGFLWDLSSSPRLFWTILPPDGDFIVGALIHDYLYQSNKVNSSVSRKFADKEMLLWSKAVNDTRKISLQKIDNYTRYLFVRLFGWIVW